MTKWVLLPVEFDDQTYEGIWTAAYNEWAEFGSADKDAGRAAVVAMLAARPPIPRDVWDAMVEQAASTIAFGVCGRDARCNFNVCACAADADAALRAALSNPRVEGDDP